jgi:hypothetical protein
MWPRVGKARGGPFSASFTSVLPLRARNSGQAQQLRLLAGEHCGCVVLLTVLAAQGLPVGMRPRGLAYACGLGWAKPAEALAVVASSSSFASMWRQLQVLPLLARLPAFNDKLVRFDVSFSSGAHRARRFQVAGAATDSGRIYQLGHHARRFQLAGAAADSGRIYQLGHRARRFQVVGAAADSKRIYQLGHRARRLQAAGAAADSGMVIWLPPRFYQLGHHARRCGLSCGWSGMAMCVGAFNNKLVHCTPGSTSQANAGAT